MSWFCQLGQTTHVLPVVNGSCQYQILRPPTLTKKNQLKHVSFRWFFFLSPAPKQIVCITLDNKGSYQCDFSGFLRRNMTLLGSIAKNVLPNCVIPLVENGTSARGPNAQSLRVTISIFHNSRDVSYRWSNQQKNEGKKQKWGRNKNGETWTSFLGFFVSWLFFSANFRCSTLADLELGWIRGTPLNCGNSFGSAGRTRGVFNKCHIVQITSGIPLAANKAASQLVVVFLYQKWESQDFNYVQLQGTIHVQVAQRLRPIQLHP